MIYLGASGYSYADWVGPVYSPGTRKRDFLNVYKDLRLGLTTMEGGRFWIDLHPCQGSENPAIMTCHSRKEL